MYKAILYTNGLMLALVIVSGAMLSSSTAIAESITANASVTVSSACTFTSTVDSAHSAIIPAGTYKNNIGTTTLKAICNDSEGFSIYAVGFSNEQLGNNKLIATVAGSLSPTNDINTGTNTSGDPSSWAMKLSTVSGGTTPTILNNYDSYHSVPTTNTKVATYASTTDATLGASITTTYAANISGTQPAGTYVGKIKYTFLHPATAVPNESRGCPARRVCYWPNGNGLVTDTMGDQYVSSNDTIDLWASNFQRKGYGFAGWSTTYDYSDPTGFYGPNETITTPSNIEEKGLSLYAIWIESDGSLQNWSACPALNIGDVTALTDTRDNETYAVAKLADGNCWMIENLRLDSSATLNLDNTNNPSLPLINLNGASSNHLSAASNTWCYTIDAACFNVSYLNTDNITGGSSYLYGNYYNFYSATAGNNLYGSSTEKTVGDICASGWRLPKGSRFNSANENNFFQLGTAIVGYPPSSSQGYITEVESNIFRKYPNNFTLSGRWQGRKSWARAYEGWYWTQNDDNNNTAFSMKLTKTNVLPGTYNHQRYQGMSVRCMLDN